MSLCPYNARDQERVGDGAPGGSDRPEAVHLRLHGDRRRVEVRAQLGLQAVGRDADLGIRHDANGGLGAWSLQTFPLKPYYDICVSAAQAGYCQDGRSYTKNGTLVDLFDTRQIIWPNAIENPFSASNQDSLWMMAQEYFISQDPSPLLPSIKDSALQRTRYRELSPVGECGNLAYVDRLEHDHIEDGRWASPLTNTPRLQVFSPTYCTHNEYEAGDALPWDCSPCTTQVCKTMPECCGAGRDARMDGGLQGAGDHASARTAASQWPAGQGVAARSRRPTTSRSIRRTCSGRRARCCAPTASADPSSSATISGWACDPEWAGRVGRRQRLRRRAARSGRRPARRGARRSGAGDAAGARGERRVRRARTGPTRATGSRSRCPMDQTGDVYVYAIDEATANGPRAPPTLIRNGVVHVPALRAQRARGGRGAVGELQHLRRQRLRRRIARRLLHRRPGPTSAPPRPTTCAPADSSAPANSRTFAAVTTGWIEAPVDRQLHRSRRRSSRAGCSSTAPRCSTGSRPRRGRPADRSPCAAGQKYHLRWDRFQAAPPSGTPGRG